VRVCWWVRGQAKLDAMLQAKSCTDAELARMAEEHAAALARAHRSDQDRIAAKSAAESALVAARAEAQRAAAEAEAALAATTEELEAVKVCVWACGSCLVL
jgi:hypothetical protein